MGKYLDSRGLTTLWNKIKSHFVSKSDFEDSEEVISESLNLLHEKVEDIDSSIYAGALTKGGAADKAVSIPFGQVDSTSTSTVFTATVDGITELRDGVCVYLKNGVVTSASGYTLNINGLGAKPVYGTMAEATRTTTIFNVNYTMLFVYNSSRVEDGCWDIFYGYNSNDNYIGYQLRTNSSVRPTITRTRYYRLLFSSADNTHWVPANTSYDNSATSVKTVSQTPINPFGRIVYMSGTTSYLANANVGATVTWDQYAFTLGYSFNSTGSALTLTYPAPVYIKCSPLPNGSAIIDSTTPYVLSLPTTDDNKIYIFLGTAYSATAVELCYNHPVYYYENGGIKLWTNNRIATVSNLETITSPGTYRLQNDNSIYTVTNYNNDEVAVIKGDGKRKYIYYGEDDEGDPIYEYSVLENLLFDGEVEYNPSSLEAYDNLNELKTAGIYRVKCNEVTSSSGNPTITQRKTSYFILYVERTDITVETVTGPGSSTTTTSYSIKLTDINNQRYRQYESSTSSWSNWINI